LQALIKIRTSIR